MLLALKYKRAWGLKNNLLGLALQYIGAWDSHYSILGLGTCTTIYWGLGLALNYIRARTYTKIYWGFGLALAYIGASDWH